MSEGTFVVCLIAEIIRMRDEQMAEVSNMLCVIGVTINVT